MIFGGPASFVFGLTALRRDRKKFPAAIGTALSALFCLWIAFLLIRNAAA